MFYNLARQICSEMVKQEALTRGHLNPATNRLRLS